MFVDIWIIIYQWYQHVSTIVTSWKKLANLQALHLWLRSRLRLWAAAAQLLGRRRQRSTAVWEAAKIAMFGYFFCIWSVFFLFLFHFCTCLCNLYLFMLFVLLICLYFMFVFWWFLHFLLHLLWIVFCIKARPGFFCTKLQMQQVRHSSFATGSARKAVTWKHSRMASLGH